MSGLAARASRTAHPRLFLVVLAGAVLLVASALAALLEGGIGPLAFRLGVLAYVLLLLGGSGYVALLLGDRLSGT